MKIKQLFILACALSFTLVISSCNKKNIKKADLNGGEDTIILPPIDIKETIDMLNTEADIRGTQFIEQENIQTILF